MVYRLVSRIIEALVILGAAVIVALVSTEVVLRYLFKHSLIFTEELSRCLMVWIVFLGSALAVRDDLHIRINVVVKRLPACLGRFVNAAAYGLIIIFLVTLGIEGIRILPAQRYQMFITIDVSMFYFYLAIPVGSVLMIFFLLPHIRNVFFDTPANRGAFDKTED
ncbi:MAG: TRAP transporter small permease [Deltaproteobacteria bacterium]|nr:TRAP transporter small permease [Deltaproteobacteria bacterium]